MAFASGGAELGGDASPLASDAAFPCDNRHQREKGDDHVLRGQGPHRRQPHRRQTGADRRGQERAARGAGSFTLLVPNTAKGLHRLIDPEDQSQTDAEQTLELALPLLEEAAGGPVEGMVGDPEPLAAIQDAINVHGFDEIIISTLPTRVSKWLKLDLPRKAAGLGLPVTTVTATGRGAATASLGRCPRSGSGFRSRSSCSC